MNRRLFELLEQSDGMHIPLQPDRGAPNNLRREDGAEPADFPPELIRKSSPKR